MRLRVLKYLSWCHAHSCKDEHNALMKVDLMVDGGFHKGTDPVSLEGKVVECDYTYPYISIAMNVTEVTDV